MQRVPKIKLESGPATATSVGPHFGYFKLYGLNGTGISTGGAPGVIGGFAMTGAIAVTTGSGGVAIVGAVGITTGSGGIATTDGAMGAGGGSSRSTFRVSTELGSGAGYTAGVSSRFASCPSVSLRTSTSMGILCLLRMT